MLIPDRPEIIVSTISAFISVDLLAQAALQRRKSISTITLVSTSLNELFGSTLNFVSSQSKMPDLLIRPLTST